MNFRHYTGATGEFFLPEIIGSGVALIDYDGDGDLDVYFVQGASWDAAVERESARLQNRLFRNDLVETGILGFTDVTRQAGVGHTGYGMGVAVGDYDNDGHTDLYVTNFGSNVLYRNEGNGTFRDVTAVAGVDDDRWSTSAVFLDYDNDADLDLFVVTYVDFTIKGNKPCYDWVGARDYCNPSVYRPLPDRLFENVGEGRFVDVTMKSGIGSASGAGLGVTSADFNSDGWTDIYVANDGTPNHLWLNEGDGTFEEVGLISGSAFNADGRAEAGMGVTAGDVDGDGDEDLFVTNLRQETNTFYRNDGSGNFSDATALLGLALSSMPFTGFGTEWFDYDQDGRLDLFVANGGVAILDAIREEPYPYHQKNQLFRQKEEGGFEETSSRLSAPELSEVSRGAAFGDLDNDGDIDIVVANNNGPARLLINRMGARRPWLMIGLRGVQSNRDGIGARVAVVGKNGRRLWRRVHTDGSYLSANDPRVHFGLGELKEIQAVEVYWPNGRRELWQKIEPNRFIPLQEGSGQIIERGVQEQFPGEARQ